MATFKVGQRVKKIRGTHSDRTPEYIVPVGTQGTILGPLQFVRPDNCNKAGYHHRIQYDGFPVPHLDPPDILAPLTDPKADAFLESIRKMKPYSEPTIKRDMVNSPLADKLPSQFKSLPQ